MTKILDVVNGKFLTFVSSIEYDIEHHVKDAYVTDIENSLRFTYHKKTAEQIIIDYATVSKRFPEEFEIVYD